MRALKNALIVTASALAALVLPATAFAVPTSTAIEGVLLSASGGPAADGTYQLTLRLYGQEVGGTAGWQEGPLDVVVKSGQFSLIAGAKTPLTSAVLAGLATPFVGIQVGNDPELPRRPLQSIAYALRAGVAEGLDCSGCIAAKNLDAAVLQPYAKTTDVATSLQGYAKSTDVQSAIGAALQPYVQASALAKVAATGQYNDLAGTPKLADVATTGKFADLLAIPAMAKVGVTCGTGLVVKGIKADGSLECVAGGVSASSLPPDGLDEVSNGLLTNQFTESNASTATPVAIPDFLGAGVSDSLNFGDYGTAQGLAVAVTVTNSDISKVRIDLYDPAGTKTTIYNGEKTGTKLELLASSANLSSLAAWIGQNPKGLWSITVADLGKGTGPTDGKIESWQVQMQTLSKQRVAAGGLFQFYSANAAPATCDARLEGSAYYNNAAKSLYICNGTSWYPIVLAPYGTSNNPGQSCKDILTKMPASKDGPYYVTFADGKTQQVTCDMTTDGGGWTVVAVENTADASGWSDGTLTNASVAGTGTTVHGMWGAGGGANKTFVTNMPHSQVRIRGRYYAVDSWDGEGNGAQMHVDNNMVWSATKSYNASGSGNGWTTASFTPAPWGNNGGPNGYWVLESATG
ncbi:MAG: proprotein convertase P-domain-containing protein, partial [Deltaproteobacteria bacterium]|nr:proprotein convertase P-domain-containing protein [Deltaproteobacteria bacterium]